MTHKSQYMDIDLPDYRETAPYQGGEHFYPILDTTFEQMAAAIYANSHLSYDTTLSTGSLASSASYSTVLATSTMVSGSVQAVIASVTSGASTNVDIRLYNGDPAGAGVIIYESLGVNRVGAALDDRNIFWISFTEGLLYLKVTNNSATPVTLSVRIRIKGD